MVASQNVSSQKSVKVANSWGPATYFCLCVMYLAICLLNQRESRRGRIIVAFRRWCATVWCLCQALQWSPHASGKPYLEGSLDLFGASLTYSSPNFLAFPYPWVFPSDVNPADVSILKKCHNKCVTSGPGVVLPHIRWRGSSMALVPS